VAIALGSMDAHAHGVVAKVGSEVEEDGGLLDLLAGAILDNGGDNGVEHSGLFPAANLVKVLLGGGVTVDGTQYRVYFALGCLAENPLRHDPLAVLAVDGVAEEGLDLLVVESLNVSTTQKGVVGGDGAENLNRLAGLGGDCGDCGGKSVARLGESLRGRGDGNVGQAGHVGEHGR